MSTWNMQRIQFRLSDRLDDAIFSENECFDIDLSAVMISYKNIFDEINRMVIFLSFWNRSRRFSVPLRKMIAA